MNRQGRPSRESTRCLPTPREVPAAIYERVLLSLVPRVRSPALRFFSLIYENFSVRPGGTLLGDGSRSDGTGELDQHRPESLMVSDSRRAGIALHSPCKLRTMDGAQISIGDHVGLNGTSITCRARMEIGSGTIVAANVAIVDSDFHSHWPPEERFLEPGSENDQPVTIGRNVSIGMGATILKGVSVGDGLRGPR